MHCTSNSSNSISSSSNTGSSGSDFEVENDKSGMPAWASAYVKESWVDIGSLLEDDDVAAGALGRGDLPSAPRETRKSKKECDSSWRTRFRAAVELL